MFYKYDSGGSYRNYVGTYDAACECCKDLADVMVCRTYDDDAILRMTTFTCHSCTAVSFVQEPHPNSPVGLARRAARDKLWAEAEAMCAQHAATRRAVAALLAA